MHDRVGLARWLRSLGGERLGSAPKGREESVRWPRIELKGAPLFVIGDVHGRLDLLQRMYENIRANSRPSAVASWIGLVGDLVDRGPQSAQVLDFLLDRLQQDTRLVCLAGNHEVMMLDFLASPSSRHPWLAAGGLETLLSYDQRFEPTEQWIRKAIRIVPEEHVGFLNSLPKAFETDLAFVSHAGIRPNVDLSVQTESDLLWRRDTMKDDYSRVGKVVVHGHQPVPEPVVTKNRINVDTGAYATGVLSAVRLSHDEPPSLLSVNARSVPGDIATPEA